MRKSLYVIFCLFFAPLIILTTNTYADAEPNFYSMTRDLGVGHLSYLNSWPISDIPENRIIRCQVKDPSKLDFFEKDDRVEKKINGEIWEIKNPETEGKIEFPATHDDRKVEIAKISTTQPKLTNMATYNSDNPWYIALKGGIYKPDNDLDDYDTGFYGEIALNRYLSKHFALEAATGYFETENSENGTVLGLNWSANQEIYVIPLTLSIKGILPYKLSEAYLGAGVGGYYVYSDLDYSIRGLVSDSDSDDDIIFGAQVFGGFSFNVTDTILLGLEGKYIFTEKADLHGADDGSNLNGFIGTGFLGFRF